MLNPQFSSETNAELSGFPRMRIEHWSDSERCIPASHVKSNRCSNDCQNRRRVCRLSDRYENQQAVEDRRSGASRCDVGIWHETYVVKPGNYEAIYSGMPPHGLGKIGQLVQVQPVADPT